MFREIHQFWKNKLRGTICHHAHLCAEEQAPDVVFKCLSYYNERLNVLDGEITFCKLCELYLKCLEINSVSAERKNLHEVLRLFLSNT